MQAILQATNWSIPIAVSLSAQSDSACCSNAVVEGNEDRGSVISQ